VRVRSAAEAKLAAEVRVYLELEEGANLQAGGRGMGGMGGWVKSRGSGWQGEGDTGKDAAAAASVHWRSGGPEIDGQALWPPAGPAEPPVAPAGMTHRAESSRRQHGYS
jgi:hypothetical protein